ncbi:MFS transporter [Pendulispora brunnea]|uniref:MFS transporter n=1 Tax=Pendulispora brunnea TaxID=2905690 RepID=A0ABZ2KHA7_9BACT
MRNASAVKAWFPAIAMMLVSLISYIDRNTLAILSPTILRETHLSVEQYGQIISAFSFAYMIGNPFWGRVLDRVGVRLGMAAAVAVWTAASTSHAIAGGLFAFAAARAVLGFGEGATFPGGLRTVAQTLPERSRGRGIAVAYSGGSLGAVLTPILITPVALALGWRAAFLCTGAIGVAWLVLWGFVSRAESVRTRPEPAPVERPRLRDPRLWGFVASYGFGGVPLGFVTYAAPIYLNRALGHDQAALGSVLWIPPLGWEIGYFFWGHYIDRGGARTRERLVPLMALLGVLSLPLAVMPLFKSAAIVLAGLFFAMFIAAGFVVGSLAYGTGTFTTGHAGYIAGLGAGGWSALIAVIMPQLGRLFDRGAYGTAFAVAAVAPPIGAALWWALTRATAATSSGARRGTSLPNP